MVVFSTTEFGLVTSRDTPAIGDCQRTMELANPADIRHQLFTLSAITDGEQVKQVVIVIAEKSKTKPIMISTFLRDLEGPNLLHLLVSYLTISL